MTRLVLASGSPYRRQLLARLGLPFESISPDIDESAAPGEAPEALARRLAETKTKSIAIDSGVVIGSDQVAALNGRVLGKPGNRQTALSQLESCQAQSVLFWTATAVCDRESGRVVSDLNQTRVQFAHRSRPELERYIELEPALDCAGSFKAEGLGITLFESVESSDPTALIGLPLIWLSAQLREMGLNPLGTA